MAISRSTLQPFFDYLKYEKRYSVHTLISYQTDLFSFFDYLQNMFPGSALLDIDHNYVRSWLAGLKEEGLTARSINRKISSLRSFFKYCLKTDEIEHSPMGKVSSPKTSKRLPVFIKEDEAARLLITLRNSVEDWKSLNALLLISVFYSSGMRLSELINLKEKQVDFEKKQIKVLGKGNKERIIPVSADLLELIRNYIEQKMNYFSLKGDKGIRSVPELLVTEKGKKLYPRYAWLLVNEWLGKTSTLDKKSPHILRHSFATHLMNNGADLNAVKELLGHSSLSATQVYTHNSIGKLRNIHKKAHPKG